MDQGERIQEAARKLDYMLDQPGSALVVVKATVEGDALSTANVKPSRHQSGARKGQHGSTRSGRPIPWVGIPARRLLGVGPTDEAEIAEVAL